LKTRFTPEERKQRKKAQDAARKAATSCVGVNPEANAVWAKLGKPGGTFNRWLNALCCNEAKALGQDAEVPPTAQVEIAEAALKRHAKRDTGNKRIQCKAASLPYPADCCAFTPTALLLHSCDEWS
jgi:hypothetical protein